jgi:sn-glycerol 3-phosphate transport system ATP-binding protein
MIYVTHDQVEAMSMADKIILLNQGQIEQQGSPESFYQNPQSLFVAGFIGHPPMNILRNNKQCIGIRPEHLMIDETGYLAHVNDCDYQGSQTVISVDLKQGPFADSKHLKLCVSGKQQFTQSCPIHISWQPRDEHHFCPKSGQRLAGLHYELKTAI